MTKKRRICRTNYSHREYSLLGDTHECACYGQDEAEESEVYVQWHVGDLKCLPPAWCEVSRKSGHILQAEDDDSAESHPRVQRVHIRYWWIGQIVRIEDGDQCNDGQYEGGQMDAGMRQLERLLAHIAEATVDEYGCVVMK